MEPRFIKALTVLGIPGVALGIFYLLLKQFGFTFSTIGPVASAIIAAALLIFVSGITLYALRMWAPAKNELIDDVKPALNTRPMPAEVIDIADLRNKIFELSETNKSILKHVATDLGGEYMGDLVSRPDLNLSRGELVYRARELEAIGLIENQQRTDSLLIVSRNVLRLLDNKLEILTEMLDKRGYHAD